VRQIADQNGWKTQTFTPEALAALKRYSWPGNVRELRNIVERLLLLSGEQVDAATVEATLPQHVAAAGGSSMPATGSLAERVDAFEREVLLAELKRHSYRMTEAAKALGLERSHLYKKCQALGIDLQAVKKGEQDS
jgi:DNA-binding NtrC family response regulator